MIVVHGPLRVDLPHGPEARVTCCGCTLEELRAPALVSPLEDLVTCRPALDPFVEHFGYVSEWGLEWERWYRDGRQERGQIRTVLPPGYRLEPDPVEIVSPPLVPLLHVDPLQRGRISPATPLAHLVLEEDGSVIQWNSRARNLVGDLPVRWVEGADWTEDP